jgi:Flp pilus assembly protein CpaB
MASIGQSRPLVAASPGMRTPLFIFGVALALVAFLVMFAFGVVFIGRQQVSGQIPVVVAKEQIDARAPITPDMLTVTSLPANAVPQGTFLHIAEVKGMAALVQIVKGQPISANLVVSSSDPISAQLPTSFLPIPEGYVAVTLPTSEQQGVGGFIAVGDYIDVVAALNTAQLSPSRPRTVVQTVFEDVYVIRVGPQSLAQRQSQVQGVASSITVVMTRCDAEYMDWLLLNATLRYLLLSSKDYKTSPQTASSACDSSSSSIIGPAQVDARWHFTSA